jgi:hypothetical protein
MGRLGLAFRCFFRVLGGKALPEQALALGKPAAPALPSAEEAAQRNGLALQLIGVLQKEGRLIDFLQEEIAAYDDAQIGAAVRSIHADCRRALAEHVSLERVLPGEEDSRVTVEPGFDPLRVRLVGNVTGEPPFEGVLRHHGWRAAEVKLPDLPGSGDRTVVAPAEVELS